MDSAERRWREEGLRQGVLAGDEAAWRALYDRGYPRVHAFVRCRVGDDSALADEVVQETWIIAVRKIGGFDPARSAFETWLIGIARNVLRNHERSRSRRDRVERSLDEAASVAAASPASGAADLKDRVARTLTSLSSRYQAVLRAKYRERLSVASIAASTGQTPKAVESLLARARTAFRETFGRIDQEDT